MNGLRSVFRFVLFVVAAALAFPAAAAAPDKIFSVAATPRTLTAGATNLPVTVTFTNQSPKGGNSYINSLKLQVPSGLASFTFVSAQTLNGGQPVSAPAPSISGNVLSFNNFAGVKPSGTFVINLLVSVPSASSCSASAWVGAAWAGNSFGGDPFTPYPNADSNVAPAYVGCDGELTCGASFTKPASLNADQPGYSSSTRSLYNKDGTTSNTGCVAVPYSFANDLLSANQTHLTWLLQDTAVFTTTVNFQLRAVDTTTGLPTPKTPVVAWLPTSGTPVFVNAQACLGTNPPTNVPGPYGTLQTTLVSGSDTPNITITAIAGGVPLPTSGTFPIVIGKERLQATYVSPNTYSITRGAGNTSAVAGPHAIGALVMSTPLPLLPSTLSAAQLAAGYVPSAQAQMCVQEWGWASGGIDSSGNQLIYDFGTFIDIGDGWIGQN